MEALVPFVKLGLYIMMGVSVLAALGVVLVRNLFHAALCLVVALLGIAGIFFALHAEFLAVVQILLYVGAVMTLVIFAIMLTERFGDKTVKQNNNLSLPAMIGSVIFLAAMTRLLTNTPWIFREGSTGTPVDTYKLGEALMGTYVFPFEVISVVLIAALIGAVVIAKKDPQP